jgi:predicted SAM-dependent methyltransferase
MKERSSEWLSRKLASFCRTIFRSAGKNADGDVFFERPQSIHSAKKVIIGASEITYSGWFATEKDVLDVTDRNTFLRHWKPASRSAFLAEHVWEHLDEERARSANANCFEFLEPGGRLRIAVPDGYKPDPDYIDWVRPGGVGPGAQDHLILYSYKSLSQQLALAGFDTFALEYWDEKGHFHFQEWLSTEGHIRRSSRYDPRNQEKPLAYTSLIVDGIKPKIGLGFRGPRMKNH